MDYVFVWRKESVWIVVTAILTYLMTLTATDFENVTDWRKFAISIGAGLVRAVIGALLATRTGGFRPEVPTGPAVPVIDEEIGVSPRAVRLPNQPEATKPENVVPTPAETIIAALDADDEAVRRKPEPPDHEWLDRAGPHPRG